MHSPLRRRLPRTRFSVVIGIDAGARSGGAPDHGSPGQLINRQGVGVGVKVGGEVRVGGRIVLVGLVVAVGFRVGQKTSPVLHRQMAMQARKSPSVVACERHFAMQPATGAEWGSRESGPCPGLGVAVVVGVLDGVAVGRSGCPSQPPAQESSLWKITMSQPASVHNVAQAMSSARSSTQNPPAAQPVQAQHCAAAARPGSSSPSATIATSTAKLMSNSVNLATRTHLSAIDSLLRFVEQERNSCFKLRGSRSR